MYVFYLLLKRGLIIKSFRQIFFNFITCENKIHNSHPKDSDHID